MTNKPQPKDFPPESPHDLEWGGYNHSKYIAALKRWEASECWTAKQPEALLSREILQPIYEKFNQEMANKIGFSGPPTASDFFNYLLNQTK